MIAKVMLNGVERPAVDDEAYELAEHFLCGEQPYNVDDHWNLAGAIQEAIEDWFDSRERAASLVAQGATEGDETTGDTSK